ncbi:MAG: glucosaminidase domain-containing protein [Rhodospirillales bacterium]|nr:glucosaminidase domain-containing protein [Rhodospirillales bacterium]
MTAAGGEPIKSAAAGDASPLGFLAAGPESTADAVAEAPVSRDYFPAAPGRFRLVFSLSEAIPRDIRLPTAMSRLLTLDSVPPGVAREAVWQEAAAVPDRPISATPRYAPTIIRLGTLQAEDPPPLPLVSKPRKLVHTGTTDRVPPVVLKPSTWGTSAKAVIARFASAGYDLDQVRAARSPVPRLLLEALPRDLSNMPSVREKKRLFFQTVLPIVLQVNEEIVTARWRLERLAGKLMRADALPPADREWLAAMADLYGTDPFDVQELLNRMDVVPPSLALAQAAEESGWGTSRFARQGNALFGQYTYSTKAGMLPERRDADRRHRVRSHDNLLAGARAYVHNLNSHWAYEDFRRRRAQLRRSGAQLDGHVLAGELHSYSERRGAYVKSIRRIIRQNRLGDFDRAWLNDRQWTAVNGPPSRRPPI